MASTNNRKNAGSTHKPSGGKIGRAASASPSKSRKLDDVSDAPESGEPRAQGRTRGRIIESDGAAAGGRSKSTSRRQSTGKRKPTASDPLAAAERDESGDTANEAWESGRQKAMDDEIE